MSGFITDTTAIKKIMVDKDVRTIKELSEKSGVNRNTLAKVLKGDIQPTSDVMQKLVSCLDIEPSIAGNIFFASNIRRA